jgi:hypothetical protein
MIRIGRMADAVKRNADALTPAMIRTNRQPPRERGWRGGQLKDCD